MLGFLPWLLLAAIAGNTIHSMRAAVAVCLVSTLFFGYGHLKKGFVLTWCTAAFFLSMLVTVTILGNEWIYHRMNVIAHVWLTLAGLLSLAVGKPFTIQYAREHVTPEVAASELFRHRNVILTLLWTAVFLVSTVISIFRYYHHVERRWIYNVITAVVIQVGITFTIWYRKRRA